MPYHDRIFRKFLTTAFLLISAAVFLLDFYLTRYTASREVDHAAQRLAAQGRLLVNQAARMPESELEAWARKTEELASARITIISPDGRVLADSQRGPETMENHNSRPEVQQARSGGMGSAVRHSATLNKDLCYVAIPFGYQGGQDYVLRMAVPLAELNDAIQAVRWRILLATLIAAGGALAIAWIVSRNFTRRIRALQSFAEGLVTDRLSDRLPTKPDDELGLLSSSLNRMAEQLQQLVERQRLEVARREAILTSMVEGVLAVDADLRITFCNRAFAELLGLDASIAESTPLSEVVKDPELQQILTTAVISGDSLRQKLQLSIAEGRSFEVQSAPLATVSRRGAVAILHDITDIERLERVRRDFVANVSHELRTPLTAIRGYAETLLDGALEDPENNRRFVEIIQAHAMRLNNIASDLLTLSELEAGKLTGDMEPVPLGEAVAAALRTVEPAARLQNVQLNVDRIDPATVFGDRTRLEQMLVNLLDNAIKFNREAGQVHIEVIQEARRVRIRVTDTGIGIPAGDINRIFERFYRVDKARSREVGGTGLGLSIVRHIVERMGGVINVESQLGAGSAFTVELPVA